MKAERSSTKQNEVNELSYVVLLVDDEPNLLRGLTRALRHHPYRIYTARSAEEAIDILKAHKVDLVVSDENMPGMCGTEFLSWVTDHLPEVTRIILTGQPNIPSALNALDEGRVYIRVHRFRTPFKLEHHSRCRREIQHTTVIGKRDCIDVVALLKHNLYHAISVYPALVVLLKDLTCILLFPELIESAGVIDAIETLSEMSSG